MKKLFFLLIILSYVAFPQGKKSVLSQAQKDSINAMIEVKVGADTVIYGSATINVGADSVIVTHGLSSTPLITQLIAKPQGDAFGYDCWIQDITSTTFKIKIGGTGYVALTSALTINWYAFNASVAVEGGSDYATPEDYGAVGDGVTDDYLALQDMFDSIPDSAQVIFGQNKTYKITTDDTLNVNKTLYIDLNGATLDFSSNTNKAFIIGRAWRYTLDFDSSIADGHKNDYFLKVPSSIYSNASKGDIIVISQNSLWGGDGENFAGSQGAVDKGELIEVASISNDTLYLTHPLQDDYDSVGVYLAFTNSISGSIKNGYIKGLYTNESYGLWILGAKHYTLDNLEVKGFGQTGLTYQNCFGGVINNIRTSDTYFYGSGQSYGLLINGSQNVSVQNCNVVGGRHPMDVTGQDLPSRNIRISDSFFDNQGQYYLNIGTLNVHQGTKGVYISNCTINGGGVVLRGVDNVLENSTINQTRTGLVGLVINMTDTTVTDAFFDIINNNINSIDLGIQLTLGDYTALRVNISNNNITSEIGTYLDKDGSGGYIKDFVFSGNIVEGGTDSYASFWVNETAETCTIDNLKIFNNTLRGNTYSGIALEGLEINKTLIAYNDIYGNGGITALGGDANTLNTIELNNNYIDLQSSASGNAILLSDSTGTNLIKSINNIYKNSGNPSNIVSFSADTVLYGMDYFNDIYGMRYFLNADYSYCYDSLSVIDRADLDYAKKGSVLFYVTSVSGDTVQIPSKTFLDMCAIDSVNASVKDSSIAWTLYTGTDWGGSFTQVMQHSTSASTSYADYAEDLISKNESLFLTLDTLAGVVNEAIKLDVFYNKINFHPNQLNPEAWLFRTVEDANNKVTEWTDRTANNNDFLQSDTSKSPLIVDNEITFNGIDDYLTIGDDADFDFGTSDITIEGWIKTDSNDVNIIHKYNGTNLLGWEMSLRNDGKPYFALYHGGGDYSLILGSQAINTGEWVHIALVLGRDLGAYLYVDGGLSIQELTTEWTDESALDVTNAVDCEIGRLPAPTYHFTGNISNLRYYKSALTQSDITNLYNYGRKQ